MNYKVRKRIDAVLSGESDTLKLDNLDLTELPEEVYTLTNLKELSVANILLMGNQDTIDLLKRLPTDDSQELLKLLEEEESERKKDLLIPRQLEYIDAKLSQLTSLEVLDLSYNRIELLPDSIGTLPKLRRLILRNNLLTGLPKSLTRLPSLELLDIRQNPIQSVPRFPQLEVYDVYRGHFYGQKHEAIRSKDIDLALWHLKKETERGLLK